MAKYLPVQNSNPVHVAVEDIARGWRVESVTTNAAISYAMPSNATLVGNWHVHGAASSFGNNVVDFGVMRTSGTLVPTNWAFPLGTNDEAISSFWYFVDGRIRPTPRDAAREICVVGAAMSAVPGRSRLWTAEEPDGSRVITWENYFLCRDMNCPVNAQILLFPNGDFTTRSNDVETVYRRVNPDDWDGDGLHNERDANPLSYDGDYFGVPNPLPTNANPKAYYWLDLCATGLLDCASIRVACDGPSDLGDHMIIARTNQVCHIPLLVGATYAVESDLPIAFSAVSSEYAEVCTNDETSLSVTLPLDISFERVATRGGTDNYVAHTSPIEVGPRILDVSGGCCSCETNALGFAWTCSESCHCGGGRHDISTMATWGGYSRPFIWYGWCPCIWHDEGSQYGQSPRLVLDMPRTLFTNNNGGAEDSDIVRLVAGLFSPVATNGTLTLDVGLGEFAKIWTTSNRTGRIDSPLTWNVEDGPCRVFYVEGAEEIERDIDCFSLTWKDEHGNVVLATNVDFAVYYPKVDVVNNSLFDNGDLCNPSGIVTGTNACFAIEFGSVRPPSGEISWSIVEGNAHFVGGDTGERVRVASDVADQRVKLRVQVDDCRSRPPEIAAYVVDPLAVKLTVWIVGNKNGYHYAVDAASVSNFVIGVNKVYEQIGVSFYLDSISYTNKDTWLDISGRGTGSNTVKRRELVNVESNTGGLELYFVNKVGRISVANHDQYGIVLSTNATIMTLAHEIGHAFGCADVYPVQKRNHEVHIPDNAVCAGHEPMDWSNGTGCRYYSVGVVQEDIIRRLLMCGHGYPERYDLSLGSIYGFSADGDDGLVDVGIFRSGSRRNVKYHK